MWEVSGEWDSLVPRVACRLSRWYVFEELPARRTYITKSAETDASYYDVTILQSDNLILHASK